MNQSKFDIIIIGGGPAGSTAAMLLSKRGFSVALIEKKAFPREVICGEFLSGEVTQFLEKENLLDGFLNLNPNPVTSFRFIGSNGKEISSEIPFNAYALKRSKLDHFLLSNAIQQGVVVYQPAEVKSISQNSDGYNLSVIPDVNLTAKIIIAAYGKQNSLDKKHNRKFSSVKSHLNGLKMHVDKKHFNNFSLNEIQIYCGSGIYCGLNAVDDNTITVCYLYNRDIVNTSKMSEFDFLTGENSKLSSLLKDNFHEMLKSSQVYGTGDIYFGSRELTDRGIFYVGDAAGVIAPLAGDGIGIAVQSAQLISRILYKNNLDILKSGHDYEKEWKEHFSGRLRTAGSIQSLIMNNFIQQIGLKFISHFPFLLPKLIRYTRG